MIRWLIAHYKYWRLPSELRAECDRKCVIAMLRREMAFWGFDTTDMTDEEIEEHVLNMSMTLASTGITADQMCANLKQALSQE